MGPWGWDCLEGRETIQVAGKLFNCQRVRRPSFDARRVRLARTSSNLQVPRHNSIAAHTHLCHNLEGSPVKYSQSDPEHRYPVHEIPSIGTAGVMVKWLERESTSRLMKGHLSRTPTCKSTTAPAPSNYIFAAELNSNQRPTNRLSDRRFLFHAA